MYVKIIYHCARQTNFSSVVKYNKHSYLRHSYRLPQCFPCFCFYSNSAFKCIRQSDQNNENIKRYRIIRHIDIISLSQRVFVGLCKIAFYFTVWSRNKFLFKISGITRERERAIMFFSQAIKGYYHHWIKYQCCGCFWTFYHLYSCHIKCRKNDWKWHHYHNYKHCC